MKYIYALKVNEKEENFFAFYSTLDKAKSAGKDWLEKTNKIWYTVNLQKCRVWGRRMYVGVFVIDGKQSQGNLKWREVHSKQQALRTRQPERLLSDSFIQNPMVHPLVFRAIGLFIFRPSS